MQSAPQTFVLTIGDKEVKITFTPVSGYAFRKIDIGTATVEVEGQKTEVPYQKTSFTPLPFPFTTDIGMGH